jgi:L-amino acid N-acyltransferase YncA
MGPNRPGPGSHVATASFMVAADVRGHGVGRALGEYALSWARERGYAAMQFNAVVESNVAAVRLWQALGFQIVGTLEHLSTPVWVVSVFTSCTDRSKHTATGVARYYCHVYEFPSILKLNYSCAV